MTEKPIVAKTEVQAEVEVKLPCPNCEGVELNAADMAEHYKRWHPEPTPTEDFDIEETP